MIWGRIVSVTAIAGALIWLLWPRKDWAFEPEPAYALAVALIGFIANEIAAVKWGKPLHGNDLALGRRFKELFNSTTMDFLSRHSMGMTFPASRLTPLEAFAHWGGVHDEFVDKKLQQSLKKVQERNTLFLDALVPHGNLVGPQLRSYSVIPDRERANDWFSPETQKTVDELNTLKLALANMATDLERLLRKRAPELYK